MLSDKSDPKKTADAKKPDAPKNPADEPKKGPMTVSFARGMKFFGQSSNAILDTADPLHTPHPAAKAEFYDDVHAWSDDGSLDCSKLMRVYFDRVVKLVRPPSDPKAAKPANASGPEAQADVAWIQCIDDVVAVNVKRDPDSHDIIEKQRIVGPSLVYEKATGKFAVPGPGMVFLYQLAGQNGPGMPGANPNLGAPNRGNAPPAAGGVIRRTAGPRRAIPSPDDDAPVVTHNVDPNATMLDRGRPRITRQPRAQAAAGPGTDADFLLSRNARPLRHRPGR